MTTPCVYRLRAVIADIPLKDGSDVDRLNLGFFDSFAAAERAMKQDVIHFCEAQILRFEIESLPLGVPDPEGPVTRFDPAYQLLGQGHGFKVGDIVGVAAGLHFKVGVLVALSREPDDVARVEFLTTHESGLRDHEHPQESEIIPLTFDPPKWLVGSLSVLMATRAEVDHFATRTRIPKSNVVALTKSCP